MFKIKVKNNRGFTLIELLVAISIIGLLSTVVLASLTSARKKAEAAKFLAEMDQFKKALELYRTDNGMYPGEPDYMACWMGPGSVCSKTVATYLKEELVDKKYIQTLPQVSRFDDSEYYAGITNLDFVESGANFKTVCGGKYLKSYMIDFYYEDIPAQDFPKFSYIINGIEWPMGDRYCIGE